MAYTYNEDGTHTTSIAQRKTQSTKATKAKSTRKKEEEEARKKKIKDLAALRSPKKRDNEK